MKIKFLLPLIFIINIIISCSKSDQDKQGYYAIETLTNSFEFPVKVEIAHVTKKLSNDLDYAKNLSYRTIANLEAKQTIIVDSTFICTSNCEDLLNETDPEMKPLFLRITMDEKVKTDTNCMHVYVSNGLIKNCKNDSKNYFNRQNWVSTKDKSGNLINNYHIDHGDLAEAE